MGKKLLYVLLSALLLLLGACSNTTNEKQSAKEETENKEQENTGKAANSEKNGHMDHSEMEHAGSEVVPENLKKAENPAYAVGSKVIINTGHMEGMEGAEATVSGAFDTIAYTISYTPLNGGKKVENHKWVIHEEIVDAGEGKLVPGTEVTINADHMVGMNGVTAEIDSAEETIVYMVDFAPTDGGEKVKNHKWVTESELSPVK